MGETDQASKQGAYSAAKLLRAVELTLGGMASTVEASKMSVKKLQVGQLWKKNDTGEIFLVTRVYSEALSTMVVLRKSGAEDLAQTKLRAQKNSQGVTIPGYSPAQDEDQF